MYGSTSPENPGASPRHLNTRIPDTLLEAVPSAPEFERDRRARDRQFLLSALLSALICGGAFTFMEMDSPALPMVLMAVLMTPILLWRFRQLPFYIALISACLFELFPSRYPDDITGNTYFFLNVNSIFQARGMSFDAIPVSIFEIILLVSGVCSLFQGVFGQRVRLTGGTLFPSMMIYLLFVSMSLMRGWADGSDYHVMLQEVRAQFYLVLAYLMALQMVEDGKSISKAVWIAALCIAFKGILYSYRRYITLGNAPLPDQGVGSHEEAFFFNCFVALLLTLWLCSTQKRLMWIMWCLLPVVVTGFLATNRRAGTAGIVLMIPVLLLAAYRGLPHRRRMAMALGVFFAIAGPAYYAAFKNSNSSFAQPARAIRSHFQPDERDATSNAYRDAENANILATVKESPLTTLIGYGYGKPFLKVVPITFIGNFYDKWDILPHNQVLWLWMRTGLLGIIAFWMIFNRLLLSAGQVLQRPRAPGDEMLRVLAIWTMCVTVLLVVSGLFDLQFSSYRNMIFVGLIAGALEGMRLRTEPPPPPRPQRMVPGLRAG